jgi:CRP-like cAMP-binding protein
MSAVTIRRLEGIELFRGCRKSQLEWIDRLGITVVRPAGRTLCSEGKPGSEFFLLVDGLVEVHSSGGRLALLHAGAWFGETALLHNTVREASVTTVVDSMLIVFDRREFNTLRDLAPQVRQRLDFTAALFARGDVPTSQPWYQPIVHAPVDGTPVTVNN